MTPLHSSQTQIQSHASSPKRILMNLAARGLRAHLSLPKPSSSILSRPMPALHLSGYRYIRNSSRLKTYSNPKNVHSNRPPVVKPSPIQRSFFDTETLYRSIVWGVPTVLLILGIKVVWDEPKRRREMEEFKKDVRENWKSYIVPRDGK